MAHTHRLDIRYVPENGVSALKRVEKLTSELTDGGFTVSDVSVFDDGMRVSLIATSKTGGRNELKLLAMVSNTGVIGRFSCRDLEQVEETADSKSAETEAALV